MISMIKPEVFLTFKKLINKFSIKFSGAMGNDAFVRTPRVIPGIV